MTRATARARRGERGQSVLYVIVLAPIVFLSLALALEAGSLQMQKDRFRSVADMATVTAGTAGAVASAGATVDAQRAEAALRTALDDNLEPLSDDIDGATPDDIALAADVYVTIAVPATDPLDSFKTLTRPTIETRIVVPVRSGLLSVAGLPPTVSLTVTSSSDLRVIGGQQT